FHNLYPLLSVFQRIRFSDSAFEQHESFCEKVIQFLLISLSSPFKKVRHMCARLLYSIASQSARALELINQPRTISSMNEADGHYYLQSLLVPQSPGESLNVSLKAPDLE